MTPPQRWTTAPNKQIAQLDNLRVNFLSTPVEDSEQTDSSVENKPNRFADEAFVNVIMSDDKEAMHHFRDFLAEHHITNVATDSYTRDWNTRTITITAYAETKKESMLINQYIEESPLKFKRVVQKV